MQQNTESQVTTWVSPDQQVQWEMDLRERRLSDQADVQRWNPSTWSANSFQMMPRQQTEVEDCSG